MFAPFSSLVKIDEDLNKMPNKEQKNYDDGNKQQSLQQGRHTNPMRQRHFYFGKYGGFE
jgi:hypothetical protein